MKIEIEQRGACTLVRVDGRLDATWADYFAETLLAQIREGHHCLVVDAQSLNFLSSAGIRAMMQVYREVSKVKGQFSVINPAAFVDQTLRSSGLASWLDQVPDSIPAAQEQAATAVEPEDVVYFAPSGPASLKVEVSASWRPWQTIQAGDLVECRCTHNCTGLGIGAPLMDIDAEDVLPGEFLVAGGNVVFQPPQEQVPADYLIAEGNFVPLMQCAQMLQLHGELAHQLRFAATRERPQYSLSWLMEHMLCCCDTGAVGFVVLGEIDGLVGATLIRSPSGNPVPESMEFPQIRDWLSFCGERRHARQQALLVGVAATQAGPLLPGLPMSASGGAEHSTHTIGAAHVHAAVFPHQPLQNGRIDMHAALQQFFSGSPPQTVMHLLQDERAVVGLGESDLIRGACWFGPIENPEVLA